MNHLLLAASSFVEVKPYVRKECLYSKYYPKFDGFKQALTECIQNAHPKHRDKLETLLAWNFQSFEKVKISTV